jgi:hypothetical protein
MRAEGSEDGPRVDMTRVTDLEVGKGLDNNNDRQGI